MSRPRWDSSTKLVVTLLLFGLGVFLISQFSAVLQPLILAAIIAFILNPIAGWFQDRLKLRRGFATLLAYLALLVILVAVPIIIIPPLAAQASELNLDLQRMLAQVETLFGQHYVIGGQVIDMEEMFQQSIGSIQGMIEPVFTRTLELAMGVLSSIVWLIFIAVVSFYLVKDSYSLHRWLENLAPPDYQPDFIRLRDEISLIWNAFFRGQLVLALVVGTIITIFGLIIGLPFALAMGVLAGFLEFLPSIGHGIWLSLASLLALFLGSTWIPLPNWAFVLLVAGPHMFFQQFDLNYLIPRIIGRRVHLPPLVVILGIVSGALLAGFLGVFLAAPTIASARVIGRYLYAYLFDLEPFPSTMAAPLPPPNPRWWKKTADSHARRTSRQPNHHRRRNKPL